MRLCGMSPISRKGPLALSASAAPSRASRFANPHLNDSHRGGRVSLPGASAAGEVSLYAGGRRVLLRVRLTSIRASLGSKVFLCLSEGVFLQLDSFADNPFHPLVNAGLTVQPCQERSARC